MAIDTVDNFWSMLSKGFGHGYDTGQQNYWNRQQMNAQEDARKRAEQMQVLQMITQLNREGSVPYTQVNQQLTQMAPTFPGLSGVQMSGPGVGETGFAIRNQPQMTAPVTIPGVGQVPATPRFTEQQYQAAGIESPASVQRKSKLQATQQKAADLGVRELEFKTSPEMLSLETYKQRADAFSRFASSAANEVISRIGGFQNLGQDDLQTLPDRAFQEIEKLGILDQFGKLEPAQKASLKGQIAGELNKAWLMWYGAQTDRIQATRPTGGSMPQWDRLHDNLMNQINAIKIEKDTLEKEMGGFASFITGPMYDPGTLQKMAKSMPELPKDATMWRQRWDELGNRQKELVGIANKIQFGGAPSPEEISKLTGQGGGEVVPNVSPGKAPQATAEVIRAPQKAIEDLTAQAKGRPRNQQQSFIRLLETQGILHPEDAKVILNKLGFPNG